LHIGIVLNSKDDENWEWVSGKKATKIYKPLLDVIQSRGNQSNRTKFGKGIYTPRQ